MGANDKIGLNKFPLQSRDLGKSCLVRFRDDSSKDLKGKIVRSDRGEPWVTIIQLEDGRFVLDRECMYSVL